MKLLAIHKVQDPHNEPPVHIWRVWRPLRELHKHVDWQIDEWPHFLGPHAQENRQKDEISEFEFELAAKALGEYDIIFASYSICTPTFYTLMQAVRRRYGTQLVLDIDDDVWSINPDNPVWLDVTKKQIWEIQVMISDCEWVTTTTEALAQVVRRNRPDKLAGSVGVLPNFITDDYQHPPIDHGDRVTIGYFGGSSHFSDLNDTGFRKAMRDIMRKYKNVDFRACGVPLDIPMARGRESFIDSVRGRAFITEVYPTLDMDIAVAPLQPNTFNLGKSNIKWQEATRAGAAFIASDLGPYHDTLGPSGSVALLVQNTRPEWFNALEHMVAHPSWREAIVRNAQHELAANYRLEDHWQLYEEFFAYVVTQAKGTVEKAA